jgi:hypothetical protein
MKMLMDRRTAFEIVVRERHVGRMKIAPAPTGQTLDDFQSAGINEWQGSAPVRDCSTARVKLCGWRT